MVNRVSAFATIARVSARVAWKSTNAVLDIWKIEALSHTRWHLLLRHFNVLIKENFALPDLITFDTLKVDLVLVLAHLNIAHRQGWWSRARTFWAIRLAGHSEESILVLIVGAKGHDRAHVSMCESFHSTTSITFNFLVHVRCRLLRAILLLLVSRKDAHMHLIVSLVTPIVLWAGKPLSQKWEHGEHHVRSLWLTDLTELLKVNFLLLAKG